MKEWRTKPMSHNYKLRNFKIVTESDTDIHERIVSMDLSKVKELPVVLVQRLERMLNKMIVDHEQERNITIPLVNMEVGIHLDIDTQEKELSLNAYIGYTIEEDCITEKEVITDSDEDYAVVKKFFFTELNHCVFEQLRRIEKCA